VSAFDGKVYGLTEKEITAGGKQRCPSEARGMIAYLVREVSRLSLADLGKRLKRDASSLSLSADKIIRCSKEKGEMRKRKKILEQKLS
jgi:chromosomal replication initiation ATPase DnaA